MAEALEGSGLSRDGLILEITENVVMERGRESTELLERLKALVVLHREFGELIVMACALMTRREERSGVFPPRPTTNAGSGGQGARGLTRIPVLDH